MQGLVRWIRRASSTSGGALVAGPIAAVALSLAHAEAAGPFDDLIPEAPSGLATPDGWTWKATGTAKVVDGDTIHLRGVKIRLWGIDAPELGQTCEGPGGVPYGCGVAAKVYLEGMIATHPVACFGDESGLDRYGRQLAICHVANPACLTTDGSTAPACLAADGPSWSLANINADMVRFGWALAYREYSTQYAGYEAIAKGERRGMWSGRFAAPWEWRKRRQET